MNVITLVEPTVEPVTLAQIYAQLRLTPAGSPLVHPDDDMLLSQRLAARIDCENRTLRSFVKRKLRLVVGSREDHWPWPQWHWRRGWCGPASIELPRPPLIEVLAVRYYDGSNVLQLVDPASYFVTDDEPARLQFVDSFNLSGVSARPDALRIDYWAGYAPLGSPEDDFTTSVPEPIKQAILIGVELQHEAMMPADREALERTQTYLLQPYVVRFVA
jgi:uncharacterized phiE125 gp8 family phage protein